MLKRSQPGSLTSPVDELVVAIRCKTDLNNPVDNAWRPIRTLF